MCGINGTIAFDDAGLVAPESISRMCDMLRHRGPDGAGIWLSDDCRVGLGHRRLSIIDLSPASEQPMANEDGSLQIVFNGAIYNHAAIRAELEQRGGHVWTTDHSDTEVILHSYEEWGIDCLERFRGMFAFGLWDGRQRVLWLVRDRIGIKPLYYSVHDGRLSFASEIKALLADPSQRRAINEEALFDYLSFLTTPAPLTMFDGIRKLPGGTWLRVAADGSMTERRWWDVWDEVEPLIGLSDEAVAERVLAELRTAVRLHKVSDVPVGVFLSGGMDSSTNAALFSEGETGPVRTFSIGYAGEHESYRNEFEYARLMAARVGAEHHELVLDEDDLLDFLPRMIALQDEPIADPVCVPAYYLSRLARDNGVIVAQLGEGADELFCGYREWRRSLQLQRANGLPVPNVVKRAGLAYLEAAGRTHSRSHEWLRRGAAGLPIFWGGAEAFGQRHKEELLSARLRASFRGRTSWDALRPIRARFEASAWEPSALNWMTYLDLNLRLPELLLMRVDKMAMGVGLEGRVPFLDHVFVGLALSIPSAAKTRRGELKAILKRAVRGLIPDELIDRPKQGFAVPLEEWFGNAVGDRIREDVDAFVGATDLLDRGAVQRVMTRPVGDRPWYLYNLAAWWRHNFDPPGTGAGETAG